MDNVDRPAGRAPRTTTTQLSPEIIVSAVVGILALALGLLASRTEPDRTLVPLISAEDRLYYLAAIILTVAAGLASTVIRSTNQHPEGRPAGWLRPGTVLPAATVAGGAFLFAHTTDWGIIALLALGTSAVTWLALWVESRITGGQALRPHTDPAPLVHLALTVGVGLLYLSSVYGFRMNMRYTGPLVFLATAALLAQGLAYSSRPRRYVPIALAGALLLAELVWVLLFWNVAAWHGGAILGLGLYTVLAVAGGHLAGGLERRDLARQAMISVPVLAILILAAR